MPSRIEIPTQPDKQPIEIEIVGKFPKGVGKTFIDHAFEHQRKHTEFVDEYNEISALINKTDFSRDDSSAVYSFGVDTRDLTFHRHAGHRIITAITGTAGCILKFSICTPEAAKENPENFLKNLHIIRIPADRLFVLRFDGQIYHQFCPGNNSANGFFAISVHSDEAKGLSGDLLHIVLANKGSIPLLTEPVPKTVLTILQGLSPYQFASDIELNIE